MWVLIDNGKVITKSLNQLDPAQVWVDEGTQEWDEYVLGNAPDIATEKSEKLAQISMMFSQYMASFTTGYPLEEMLSWDQQEREADAYNANSNANAPLISGISSRRGVAMTELQLRIRKKAAAYKYGTGVLIGERQRCEDLVDTAATSADLEAIVFSLPPTFLADVQAAADAVV
jgi:hypothetical protein